MRTIPRSRSNGLRSAALALTIFFPIATVSSTAAATTPNFAFAMAKKKKKKKGKEPDNKLTAAQAEEARTPIQERAGEMSESPDAAGSMLAEEARTLGDPILFIEAGDAFKAAGAEEREVRLAERAIEEAKLALDILYFLEDPRADPNWEIVASTDVTDLISRAQTLIDDSETLIEEIEAEQAPDEEEQVEEKKKRTPMPRDGRFFIGAGSLMTVVGIGGVGMLGAGLSMGSSAQKTVEDPEVTGDEFDEADAKGKRANVISYAGIGVAAVGLISGAALLVIGVKKRKAYRADNGESASVHLTPVLGRSMTGLSLSGRF